MFSEFKIEPTTIYVIKFVNWTDGDVIQTISLGKNFYKLRNHLFDMGYKVKHIFEMDEEVTTL